MRACKFWMFIKVDFKHVSVNFALRRCPHVDKGRSLARIHAHIRTCTHGATPTGARLPEEADGCATPSQKQ